MKSKVLANKFNRTIISAVLMIALAFTMIGGATLAIFTSTSSVNVAITSGTVSVKATPKNVQVYSPTLINPDGSIKDSTNIAVDNTFAGGGTAVLEGNKLTLSKIAAGDSVEFDIDFANASNIAAKYRLKIEGKGKTTTVDGVTTTDDILLSALKTTIKENDDTAKTYNRLKLYVSEWRELPVSTTAVSSLHVKIELPADRGNEYQNRECSFIYSIEAVQSNTKTEDYVEQFGGNAGEAYIETLKYIYTAQDLYQGTYYVKKGQGGTFILAQDINTYDITLSYNAASKKFEYDSTIEGKNVTIDLNGHKLTIRDPLGECAIIKNNASLTIKNGTVEASRPAKYDQDYWQPMFFLCGSETPTDTTPETVDSLVLDKVTVNYISTATNSFSTIISSNAVTDKRKANVELTDCTINVEGPVHCAVYLPNPGKRTFKNVNITGDRVSTSLFITGGDWNITGGSYVGNKYELGMTNQYVQDAIIPSENNTSLWEGKPTAPTFAGSTYIDGVMGMGSSWGTGDAICIVNRCTVDYAPQRVGKINISGTKFTIGGVALAGDTTSVADGTVLSGPSGYAVRIYDTAACEMGAVSIKNINVTSPKQVIKGATEEVTLPYIHVTTAGEGDARNYSGVSEYTAAAR